MPAKKDPIDTPAPKPTKDEQAAALAARLAAQPVKGPPDKGKPKPKADKGGKLDPKATPHVKGEPIPAVKKADGFIRFEKLDAAAAVSRWIILPPAAT